MVRKMGGRDEVVRRSVNGWWSGWFVLLRGGGLKGGEGEEGRWRDGALQEIPFLVTS